MMSRLYLPRACPVVGTQPPPSFHLLPGTCLIPAFPPRRTITFGPSTFYLDFDLMIPDPTSTESSRLLLAR